MNVLSANEWEKERKRMGNKMRKKIFDIHAIEYHINNNK